VTAELVVAPRGPYSLALSSRFLGDATRRFRDGVVTALLEVDGRPELARAAQSPAGTVTIQAPSPAAAERLRWTLALDDDHTPFLRLVAGDPLLGRASVELGGLRQVRTATVAHALLRAVCGQLVDWARSRSRRRSGSGASGCTSAVRLRSSASAGASSSNGCTA
jgi:3-methyladenine DNA glycosylase/8-oxoguanine DNA glycosylase